MSEQTNWFYYPHREDCRRTFYPPQGSTVRVMVITPDGGPYLIPIGSVNGSDATVTLTPEGDLNIWTHREPKPTFTTPDS